MTYFDFDVEDWEDFLPDLDEARAVGRTYATHTALGIDVVHPRVLGYFCADVVQALRSRNAPRVD